VVFFCEWTRQHLVYDLCAGLNSPPHSAPLEWDSIRTASTCIVLY
jgi:hypothetical protein